MKKIKLLFATALLLCTAGAWAQTDVTSTYLTNADFEGSHSSYANPKADRDIYQPNGWDVAYNNGEENDLTSLCSETTNWANFSSKPQPANGDTKTYWMRFRWGNSENITLSQETSDNLPAGTYCVSVDAYSDDNTGIVTISAAGLSKTVRTNGSWANYTLVFTLASEQKVTVSLSYTNTEANDQVAAFDNVKILNLTSEPTGITLRNDLAGTTASLSDFNVWYDDYTLEVEGTADTEITVAADNISYTPEATGTVRFVKKDGIVYVFEGTTYKTAVHSSKAAYVYSTSLSSSDSETGNILENGSFETVGDVLTANKAWKLGSPWIVDNFSWGGDGSGIRVQLNGSTKRLVWRGSGNNAYFSQPVDLVPYKGYKTFLQQVGGGNATAQFNVGLGNAAGDYSYMSTQFTLGNGKNGTYNAELGINGNVGSGYFSFRNTSNNTASSGSDPVTQIDWIGLVGSDDFPISGVSSASYVYGTAYAPATAKSSYLAAKTEAEATIANATYDNVTGSERTNLQAAIDADVDDSDAAYNTATDNIQTAQDAFTGALTHYQALIDAQDAVPDLAYASTSASEFKTAVATSADDADDKLAAMTTNIRAYYESHALAEGNESVDYTARLTNYNNPSNTSGWTITNTTGNSNMRTMNNESYTDADGTNNHSYFDSNSWGAAFATTFTQDVTLPAGKYLLTVKARGNGTTTYKVIAGSEETSISAIGNTGGVFGRGWNDYSVEFELDSDGDVTLGVQMETGSSSNWLSFGNFRLMRLNVTLADDTDYSNLSTAIAGAEAKTLGFEYGEYAPYENVDVLTKLAEAKAINSSVNNEQEVVQGLTAYLNDDANWAVNSSAVDAIYNGNFAEDLTGWTRTNGWGQQQKGLSGDFKTAYYNQPGSLKYGNQGVYTMPLAANTAYALTFSYRSHEENSNNSMTVSVLNDRSEGLAAVKFGGNGSTSEWKTVIKNFKTGDAGNYVLTLANDGNTWMTGVSLVKATSESVTVTDADYATYVSDVDLDFTSAAIKAYIATTKGDGTGVTFTPINKVPAGTGVLLYKDGGATEVIPFFTGAADATTGNKFVRGTGAAVATDDGTNYNYILNNVGGNIGFYKANDNTVAKNRAYISILKSESAAIKEFISLDLEDAPDGISLTPALSEGEEAIYNVAGQRLNKMQKGINIVNGKKVLF